MVPILHHGYCWFLITLSVPLEHQEPFFPAYHQWHSLFSNSFPEQLHHWSSTASGRSQIRWTSFHRTPWCQLLNPKLISQVVAWGGDMMPRVLLINDVLQLFGVVVVYRHFHAYFLHCSVHCVVYPHLSSLKSLDSWASLGPSWSKTWYYIVRGSHLVVEHIWRSYIIYIYIHLGVCKDMGVYAFMYTIVYLCTLAEIVHA